VRQWNKPSENERRARVARAPPARMPTLATAYVGTVAAEKLSSPLNHPFPPNLLIKLEI
jgi:hypothetical protein